METQQMIAMIKDGTPTLSDAFLAMLDDKQLQQLLTDCSGGQPPLPGTNGQNPVKDFPPLPAGTPGTGPRVAKMGESSGSTGRHDPALAVGAAADARRYAAAKNRAGALRRDGA
jgi:hypothetical protein